jgi:Rrf2 family cysteine metabolism transcriptional repressor
VCWFIKTLQGLFLIRSCTIVLRNTFEFRSTAGIKSVSGRAMNISVKSEYALKAVFDLAVQYLNAPPGTVQMSPIKIADIAKRQRIPQKFLELILAGLKQSGFVDSRRGAEGGYLLARSVDNITVGDVLRAVENVKGGSRAHGNDPFGEVWRQVDQAISDVLDQTTFGELARGWQTRQSHFIPNWDI